MDEMEIFKETQQIALEQSVDKIGYFFTVRLIYIIKY